MIAEVMGRRIGVQGTGGLTGHDTSPTRPVYNSHASQGVVRKIGRGARMSLGQLERRARLTVSPFEPSPES